MKIIGMILLFLPTLALAEFVTVSGISSGAYMAQQFQLAHSASVSGAGVIAGGPFFCARNQILDALNRCMKTGLGLPRGDESVAEARRAEEAGEIDSLNNLTHARILVLAGTEDQTVLPQVGEVLVKTYRELGIPPENLRFINDLKIGHAFPTEGFGNPCPTPSQSPYLSKCGRDMAGEILTHLLGPLTPKLSPVEEHLKTYEQLSFTELEEERANLSLGKKGYAYVPEGCEAGNCRIHVAFHGCKQTLDDIQESFIRNAGYNAWAEANRIIILYPQAVKSYVPNNPNGCWDWWGYTGRNYHTKLAPQMKVIMRNIEDLKRGQLNFLPLH